MKFHDIFVGEGLSVLVCNTVHRDINIGDLYQKQLFSSESN